MLSSPRTLLWCLINLFSDAQIGPSAANQCWRLPLQPLCEGMYGRSSGENVFRAFISTSSDWFPLQLHMLALALQRPLLVTDHFDESIMRIWKEFIHACAKCFSRLYAGRHQVVLKGKRGGVSRKPSTLWVTLVLTPKQVRALVFP